MDPAADAPPGFDESQRGRPGGFVGDPDIMDTWATSSLTPQIAGRWVDDADLWRRVFPMDIRPQGPEIIRTWLFSTVVRSHYEHGSLPWAATTINGWILDPDRKKMSKSKGNVVTPAALFDQYGTDAVRYWAIAARPGVDTAFSEEQMKVGRRLATKLLNVTKFVLGLTEGAPTPTVDAVTDPSTRRCWSASMRRSPRRRPRSTASTTPGRWSGRRRSSGGSATTTSSSSRAAPTGRAATRRPPRRAPRSAPPSTPCRGCWHRRSPSRPRRRGAGRTTAASTRRAGRSCPAWPIPASTSTPSARSCSGCAGPRRRPSAASGRRSPGSRSPPRLTRSPALAAAHDDLADALTIGDLSFTPADALAVDVTLD